MSGRVIFRESALEAYRRGMDRDVLPRVTYRPILITSWLLVAVLLALAVLAWSVRVPTSIDGAGIILSRHDRLAGAGGGTIAALFVPAGQAARLRKGLTVQVQLSTGVQEDGRITRVKTGTVGPYWIRKRFARDGIAPGLVTRPSILGIVRLRRKLPARAYAGSTLTVHIPSRSTRLLALLPQIGQFLSGGS